ncbi:MAG: hypothetical protein ACMG5Z_06515, partial [Luteimonas sp.]
ELDAEEAEAHVPDLPERQLRFGAHRDPRSMCRHGSQRHLCTIFTAIVFIARFGADATRVSPGME